MNLHRILTDPEYPKLKYWVLDHTGLSYYHDKDEDFAARLARRITARAAPGCARYLHLLLSENTELEALIGELTIGETYFFRQPEHFDLLRTTVIPGMLERNEHTRRLRIWSAGCANGAEPYTISALLALFFRDRLRGWDVSILATDINVEFLLRAETALFGRWALREVPADIQGECFEPRGNQWLLRAEYRRGVRFEYHNLVADAPFPGESGDPFDVIFCRNVMIYFSADRVRQLADRLFDSLAEGGWLLVGHAEPNPEIFGRFHPFSTPAATAYRRLPAPADEQIPYAPPPEPFVPEPLRPSPVPRKTAPVTCPPGDVAPSVEQITALADRGEWHDAEEKCRRLIAADPLNAHAHLTLGLIAEHNGDRAEAETSFRSAIYLRRGFALAHYHLGVTLQAKGSRTQALKSFQNVLELMHVRTGEDLVEYSDGMTVAELAELAQMHMELLA